MKLHERPVDCVTFGGRRYRIDADFRHVLRAMEILDDDALLHSVQVEKALRCFTRGRLPKDQAGLLDAILNAVLDKGKSGRRVLSLTQDADMILAGFRQAYGIDLTQDKLHWQVFTALLGNLPSVTRMAEVIDLRTRPVPKATKYNREQRAALLEAKAAVALHAETPEKAKQQAQASADHLANALFALVQKRR